MANDKATLAEALEEIEALREKLAAFEAFVRACDNEFRMDWWERVPSTDEGHVTNEAREALRQYETLT